LGTAASLDPLGSSSNIHIQSGADLDENREVKVFRKSRTERH
jgi:hypothetical protein